MSGKLTEAQREILQYMARQNPDDPFTCAGWIAEGCGHYYNTPWASGRLPGLAKRGLIKRGGTGWYAITEDGRAALNDQTQEGEA